MATKNFTVQFERNSKIIYRSILQNFYICFTLGDIVPHLELMFNLINNVLVTSQLG